MRTMGRVVLCLLWICVGLAFLTGCAPKRPVLIPGPRGGSTSTAQTPSTAAPVPSTPSAPSASIKEKPLTSTPQEAPSGSPTSKPQMSPQYLASVQLVHEGDRALANGDLEGALNFYEQAIQVDGYNGLAFLGLAKVWMQKNVPKKSLEFAKKAEILLTNRPEELRETYLLESFLYEMLNQPESAKVYKEKAQKVP
ncbi:tetratricopeptide repeat protein [Desulfosoma caldarium]|uniref:Tetratricopeptide repeat protein n=1 Tax=Desulfosoma caldarium TaxID=610254 RepID=A0A3N1V022_9BACT|nr:tetratricopeptide repeat protein [Desulfosoma caldarium]ROQ93461.1 tetratricopeptide repeat protein [Desulfosoma caldarium]